MTEQLYDDHASTPKENNLNASELKNFRPQNTITLTLIILFGAGLILSVAAVFSGIALLNTVDAALKDSSNAIGVVGSSGTLKTYSYVQFIQTIISFTGSIVFLFWNYRAYKNLDSLNTGGRKYAAWWAPASYFIPILFFFRPYQIMREIWKGSDPAYTDSVSWKAAPSGALILVWWLIFLLDIITGLIVSRWSDYFTFIGNAYTYLQIKIFADFTEVCSALFLILVIIKISRRQKTKYAKLIRSLVDDVQTVSETT